MLNRAPGKKGSARGIRTILMLVTLLCLSIVQLAELQHASEHPLHAEDKICEQFLASSCLAALPTESTEFNLTHFTSSPPLASVYQLLASPGYTPRIRGPPQAS